MKRFKPVYGIVAVLIFSALILVVAFAFDKGRQDFVRVGPDRQGLVRLEVKSIAPIEARFYRFLNAGNQEVKFFVARDAVGALQVAFDASENDFKRKRGFRKDGEWMVNNKCETAVRLSEVNAGRSGCGPRPLVHHLEGEELVIRENDILEGWRYFR